MNKLMVKLSEIHSGCASEAKKIIALFKHHENKRIMLLRTALIEICNGSCYDINWLSDGKDYDVANKALKADDLLSGKNDGK